MNDSNQNEAGTEELEYEESFSSTEGAETNEGAAVSLKDADTVLSLVVLLLSCLALAALAHVLV